MLSRKNAYNKHDTKHSGSTFLKNNPALEFKKKKYIYIYICIYTDIKNLLVMFYSSFCATYSNIVTVLIIN